MNLETYLRQATMGLFGKAKQNAMLELRGNIEARIWTLEHQGNTPSEALEITLQELGSARAIRAGLLQVQFVPTMLRAVILAGIAIWSTFPFVPIEARVQASPNFDATGNVLGFEISTRSLEQALAGIPEAPVRFSVARAFSQSPATIDLEQLLQTLCADAPVTLNHDRNTVSFTIDGRSRWALMLEVSEPIARAWHAGRNEINPCRSILSR
jgi:hypothetical protein